jgi:hypothetical protein
MLPLVHNTNIFTKLHDKGFGTMFGSGAIQVSHTHILRDFAGIGSAPQNMVTCQKICISWQANLRCGIQIKPALIVRIRSN